MVAKVTMLTAVVGLVALGFVAAELSVYAAHRWISHAGLLRRVRNDLFRRAHYHHHFEQYPPQALRADAYVASRDMTFVLVETLLILCAVTMPLLVELQLSVAIAMAIGVAVHGTMAATAHAICHVTDDTVRRWPLLRAGITVRTVKRLRQFHDLHHIGEGNYSLLVPLVDRLAGTRVRNIIPTPLLQRELFPRLSENSSSSRN